VVVTRMRAKFRRRTRRRLRVWKQKINEHSNIHCVQKSTPTHNFFHISMNDIVYSKHVAGNSPPEILNSPGNLPWQFFIDGLRF